jgi:hypothetical protein
LRILAFTALAATAAWGGSITSETYTTAYSAGLGLIFPTGLQTAQSGPTASFYFTGVAIKDATGGTANTFEGCAPTTPVGNGITGCPTTRGSNTYTDGTNATKGSATVSAAGDSESYSGSSTSSALGLDETGSFSITRTSGLADQTGSINDYALANEAFTVAPDATHSAGATGFIVLNYSIVQPNVTGSATGANEIWFGQWQVQGWLSTGTTSTDQWQIAGVDLSTLSSPTVVSITVPFVFGSPTIVKTAYDVGMQWSATGTGAVNANASFDPLQSLTGITVEDSSNNPLSTYSLTDGSGNQFGPNGVVPEPSTYLLAGLGLLFVFLSRRKASRRWL